MASPEKVVGKVCGWGGVATSVVGILSLFGVPGLAAIGAKLAATLGLLGCGIQAATPPVIRTKEK